MSELKKPRTCQKEAIDNFEKYFYDDENDRGIISMCCGSGKTYTTFLILKKCINEHDEKFFIIETSRVMLIQQLFFDMIEWFKLSKIDVQLRTIGGEGEFDTTILENKMTKKEADKLVKNAQINSTTDIKNAISGCNNKKPLLIITTYNSGHKIKEAIDGNAELFPDLIILDESHNTTGENAKYHQDLISVGDENFSANKYLFMTATPLELVLKNKNSTYTNDETTYSMSNETIYGLTIYEYTFYQGTRDKILVPFDTIYLTQKEEMGEDIKKEVFEKSKEDKQDIYFRYISTFLIDSIEKYKLKHILVYLQDHAKITLIKLWINEVMKTKKLEYEMYSIISEDGKTTRKQNLVAFRKQSNVPKILLSVAIFNEGVDEPCIDSVMFAQERNSDTTIAQNIGRCLRSFPNKNKSYVLIPNVIHEYGDENDKSVLSSRYKRIREVAKILNKDTKNHFYKKNIKGKDIKCNIDNDEFDDKLDQCDEIEIKSTKVNKQINIPDNQQVVDLSKYFKSTSTSDDISNKTLKDIKDLVNEAKIKSIIGYGIYCEEHGLPYIYLHEDFKREWVSWGEFLCGETFTFDEAKKFIKKYVNLKDINTSEEFINHYCGIIKNELHNKRDKSILNDYVLNMMKIPNRPSEYYKGDWISWDDFLDKELVKKILKIGDFGTSTKEQNAENNLKNLCNGDKDKISQFSKNNFNDIKLPFELDIIKKYFDSLFGINCIVVPRVRIKNNGNYESCILNISRFEDKKTYKIPIVVKVDIDGYSYDPDICNIPQLLKKDKCDRIINDYFKSKDVKDLLKKISEYCKDEIKKYNNVVKQEHEKVPTKKLKINEQYNKNNIIENSIKQSSIKKAQVVTVKNANNNDEKKPTKKILNKA
jgi:superfamily II DNA or RNA helicase/tRNA isopentenyl-2-thiomethyl-A-37 hydroxylase MiaE